MQEHKHTVVATAWHRCRTQGVFRLRVRVTATAAGRRLDAKLDQAIATVRGEMRTGFAEQRADLRGWVFAYRGSSVATTIGIVLLVLKAVTQGRRSRVPLPLRSAVVIRAILLQLPVLQGLPSTARRGSG